MPVSSGKEPSDDDASPAEPSASPPESIPRSFFNRAVSGDDVPSPGETTADAPPLPAAPSDEPASDAAAARTSVDERAATWLSSIRPAPAPEPETPPADLESPAAAEDVDTEGTTERPADVAVPAADDEEPAEPAPERVVTSMANDSKAETPPPSADGPSRADAARDSFARARERLPRLSIPAGGVDGLWGRITTVIDPVRTIAPTVPHQITLSIGAVLALLSLLADSAGSALIVAGAVAPILILLSLNRQDVFETEPPLVIAAILGIGAIAGLIFGGLAAWIANANWFSTGILNYGAAGFGGAYAKADGSAPFFVWFINGLIMPLAGLAGIVAAPIALRRFNQFRNEVMDGVILTGAGAAGFAIGTGIIFWMPIFSDGGPHRSVADWTLTIIGMTIVRPIILLLTGAMFGAAVWRYMITPRPQVLILPASGAIGGVILMSLGSIWIQPASATLWWEVLWISLVAVAVFVLYRIVVSGAISDDRKTLGDDGSRVVCPHCHQLTLKGAFCSRCGEPLDAAA